MSILADTTEMPVKTPNVMTFGSARFTAEEIAFANAEGLDRLEARYVLRAGPRPATFTTPEGGTYRNAGSLYVRTCKDGERRFVAYMHEDSCSHDFRYFDRVIQRAAFGRMEGWSRYTFKDGEEGWIFDYPNYEASVIDGFRPASIILTDTYESPDLRGHGSSWGLPCDEPQCRREIHESDDSTHVLDALEAQLGKHGNYEIEICKDVTRPDSAWYVNVWSNGDLSQLTPEHVARFANDLQWMGIECSTANTRQAERSRASEGA